VTARAFEVADLFCGAGGTSSGAQAAIRAMGARMDLVAINHWATALETHRRNHPAARHECVNLDAARPETLVPGRRLDLLMASPECVFFSRARGGRPVNDQQRMSAWHVQRWCSALDVRCVLVENVPEFLEWGPLLPNGRPDPARRRLYFEAWVQALWAMGYAVDWKLLNAADFGEATTRTRLFVQARKDGVPIRWPEPTHAPRGASADLFGPRERWRSAREVIDWSNPGRSLFDRKAPLAINTRRRIARGAWRYWGALAPLYVRLLDLPEGEEDAALPMAVGDPFWALPALVAANRMHNVPRPVGAVPTPTITSAGGGGLFVVEPSAEPLPTIAADGAIALVAPLVVDYHGNGECAEADVPLGTQTTRARFGLVEPRAEPFLVPQFGERDGQMPRVIAVDGPLPAVTSHGAGALVEPLVVQAALTHQAGPGVRTAEEPLYTITAGSRLGVAQPVLLPAGQEVDPRRLVLVDGRPHLLDIRFRMLTNGELAKAMGFDDDESRYEFVGTKGEVTKQIGNAVSVKVAAALVGAILGKG
jgi:DNA (cytosine-5)-methyltransferase 1